MRLKKRVLSKQRTMGYMRKLIFISGKSVAELANEYGLVEQTIYKWKKLYAPTIEVDENQTISMKEYKDFQKKMRELEMENEILKKAIFARKQ